MKQIQTIDDVFPALDELSTELMAADHSHLAATIQHRLHKVAWTVRSELFEELRQVLSGAVQPNQPKLPEQLRTNVEQILHAIDSYLNSEI